MAEMSGAVKSLKQVMAKRMRFLAVLFVLALLAAGVRAWYIASFRRLEFIAAGENAARRTFAIPAQRGRIFDASGLKLVWSERYCDLVSTLPAEKRLHDWELETLRGAVGALSADFGVLRRNLSAEEVLALELPLRSGIRARIVSRDERMTVDSPAVRRRAEKWEVEHASSLAGRDGSLMVMLDRFGKWIPSTVRIVEPPRPGTDLHLKKTLEELEAEDGD